jgi:hypothetical protein
MDDIVHQLLLKFVERTDAGAAHEFLGSPIRADYFRDFEALAARQGLHVVGDANPTTLCDRQIPGGALRDLYTRTHSWSARQELLDMFAGVGGGRDAMLSKRPRSNVATAGVTAAAGPAAAPRTIHASFFGAFDRGDQRPGELAWHQGRALRVSDAQAALFEKVRAASPDSVRVEPLESDSAEFLCIHGYIGLSTRETRVSALAGGAPNTTPLARAEVALALRELSSPLGYQLPNVPAVALTLSLADGRLPASALADVCRAQWAARAATVQAAGTLDEPLAAAWAKWWPSARARDPDALPPPSLDAVNFEQLIDRLGRLGYFC